MIELNQRAEQFLDSIRAEGEKSCAAIQAETARQVNETLAATRAAEQARAARTIKFETERARTQANRDLSAARMAARAALTGQRQALADSVFADAKQKLADFAASKAYAAWLGRSAAVLRARMGEGATLYARPADLALLQAVLPAGCTAQADETITLGGLKASGAAGALCADDTLETRLAAQRDWFLSSADLTITV